MSFSTKSSRETTRGRMSSQTNVLFKTILLFRTHEGERNTQSNKPDARSSTRVGLRAYCCLSLMQFDRCLCTTGDMQHESHPQLLRSACGIAKAASGELSRNARDGCWGRCLEHHQHVVFRNHADRLIPTAEIRAANVGAGRTAMQFVPRRTSRAGCEPGLHASPAARAATRP